MSSFLQPSGARAFFDESHTRHLLLRIRFISILLIVTYPYYFYIDFVQLKDFPFSGYRLGSILIHSASLPVSALFLGLYRVYSRKPSFKGMLGPVLLIHLYAGYYIWIGAASSLNSQSLTGNVDAYIIILLSTAIVLPLKPRNFLFLLLSVHPLFLIVLFLTSHDKYTLLSKQTNTTATAVIAFFIVSTFYHFRQKDFTHTEMLQKQEESLRKLFAVNPYPLVLSRIRDDKILLLNAKAAEYYHIHSDNVSAIDAGITYRSRADQQAIMEELSRTGSIQNHICQLTLPQQTTKWAMINYEQIEFENESCILAGITDITELKKVEIELTKHASTDAMTGVLNRRHGLALLQEEMEQAKELGSEFVVCFVDINNLKEVNDRYGHAEGDQLIHAACRVMQSGIDPQDYLFRYGGDEFVIVFHRSLADVRLIWREIRGEIRKLNQFHRQPFTLSLSHGLFVFQSSMEVTVDEIIHAADSEMYKAKRLYKNNL
ncbi:GGDEF domain-containing protein [Paenibacillus sp. FJAT-26967]|uniref:sensor domain-containing diguanylate cyclase n=1 Tax=Paenibacillus sp. FJAT-26967 TaxID=1729690 RepID=UPI000837FFFA|nr:GGDEF domain-containing protein [Paenibacillus sp. FJAT-26967]